MITLFAKVKKKNGAKKKKSEDMLTLREIFSGKRRREVAGIAWWALSLLALAAFWPHAAGQNALGLIGEVFYRLGYALTGVLVYFIPLITVLFGVMRFKGVAVERRSFKILGMTLALMAITILIELIHAEPVRFAMVKSFYVWDGADVFWAKIPKALRVWGSVGIPAGGFIAHALSVILVTIFSTIGTYIICGTVLIISLYLLEAEPYLVKLIKRITEKIQTSMQKTRQASADHFGYVKQAAEKSAHQPKITPSPLAEKPAPAIEAERPKIKISAMPSVAVPVQVSLEKSISGEPAEKTDKPKESAGKSSESTEQEDKDYVLPGLDMLEDPKPGSIISEAYFEEMSQTLENALGQFGVDAKVVEVCPGPVVTRYELQLSPGVKVSRIITLADDIALAMKAAHVRIEAPIPGKGAVGIEIPNAEKQIVVLKEFVSHDAFKNAESILTFAIGKDIGGQHIMAQLETMPHLLIAGATGSGKSACINSIISSLLYKATPQQVKFLMVDPKRVELTMYNGIPHLKSPVITDSREASVALRLMVKEMEERYQKFAEMGVRDISAYNERVAAIKAEAAQQAEQEKLEEGESIESVKPVEIPPWMPYVIIFIDELADLMMISANEVENTITRLAQMARGVGIHMVLATQRPSVDVITGVIKANFPSRIAFQVSSKVDSRTILDANGADSLLGRGDMLYSPASAGKPLRVQGVFITTQEVDRIVKYWKKQGKPVFDQAFFGEKLKAATVGGSSVGGEEDVLFEQAVGWVVRAKQASTSMLQRRLKVGYSRAARLLDLMEEKGIVGPPEGSKPRKVLIQPEEAGIGSGDGQEEMQ